MKKISFILILLGLGLSSCNQNPPQRIEVNAAFLGSNVWKIDSIYGEDSFTRDWLYFTPEMEFYRCSYGPSAYLIDSALTWRGNQILRADKIVYEISAIDSQFIKLNTFDKVYRARRDKMFRQENLDQRIEAHAHKLMITGAWELDSMEVGLAMMPSFCKEVRVGALYDFKEDGLLQVFENDSVKACGDYSYSINRGEINITEYDMVMSFPIEEISPTKLVFWSSFASKGYDTLRKTMNVYRPKFKMYFTKAKSAD